MDGVGSRTRQNVSRLLGLATFNRFTSGWADDSEFPRRGTSHPSGRLWKNLPAALRKLALCTFFLFGPSAMASAGGCCPGDSVVAARPSGTGEEAPDFGALSAVMAFPQWLLSSSLPMPPEYTIRHIVPQVQVEFSVLDKSGRLVTELSAADVEVFEDERSVEQFLISTRPDPLPLTLEIMLDTSDSFRKMLPTERATLLQLLRVGQQPGRYEALLTAFDRETRTWTAGEDQLAALFDWTEHRSAWSSGQGSGTILYDAIYNACRNHMGFSDKREHRRHLLVVVSDGLDTDSLHQLADVIHIAQRTETRVFTLTSHRGRTSPLGDRLLQRLAEETGGQSFVAGSSRELVEALAQIEREASARYLLSFHPAAKTPGFHSLRIRLRKSPEARIQARRAYFTPDD